MKGQYFSLSDFAVGSPERELLEACMQVRVNWGQCLWCTELAEDNQLGCLIHQRTKSPVSKTNSNQKQSNSTEEQ